MNKVFSTFVYSTTLFFLNATSALAQGSTGGNPGNNAVFPNPIAEPSLSAFLNKMLDAVIVIAVPIIVLAFVYAGFLLVSAQGNEAKVTAAKKAILWALIGGLLILGAKAIATAIEGTVSELKSSGISELRLALKESPFD